MITLLFLPLVLSQSCTRYSCTHESLEKSQCEYSYSNHVFLKPCTSKIASYCEKSETGNSTCTRPIDDANSKEVGEKCYYNPECSEHADFGCKVGICKGFSDLDEDYECQNSFYCQPGFYCNKARCIDQISIGKSGCITDFECMNQATCDGGFCVPYQLLKVGEETRSCQYGVNYACESLLCYTDYFGKSFCMDKPKRKLNSPIKCLVNEDCTSLSDEVSGITIEGKCSCGLNENGDKYCELVPGDDEYSKYIELLKAWRNSKAILKCNTMARDNVSCKKDWWDYESTVKLLYYEQTVKKYPKLQNTSYCVEAVYLKDYFELKHEFSHI